MEGGNLLTCSQRMMYVSDKVKKEVCTTLDRSVYALDGAGEWPKKMVMGVVDSVNKLPMSI